ncbi:MAG: hypothetical protein GXP33_07480 [Spirochaetes bacterium]|nr:hypothetical protein [Spirochaetota bacterium]
MRLKFSVIVILGLFAVRVFSETLCLYVEENTNGKPGPFPPPTKEGIYYGLFDGDHIVFDTGDKNILRVNWKKPEFTEALNLSVEGGARYLVAVRVNTAEHKTPDKKTIINTAASFYLYDARYSKLIKKGNVEGDNRGKEGRINQKKLDFTLGEKIAAIINDSIKKYVDKL